MDKKINNLVLSWMLRDIYYPNFRKIRNLPENYKYSDILEIVNDLELIIELLTECSRRE